MVLITVFEVHENCIHKNRWPIYLISELFFREIHNGS